MEQSHKVLFILIGLTIVAAMMGFRSTFKPAAILTGTRDDADSMVLGDSAVRTGETKGPPYLTSNVAMLYPPPLAHLNPVTSTQTGC